MKYCLSSRCTPKYLSQIDEIKVEWRDRDSILDLINTYQSATIVLICEEEINQEIEEINMLNRAAAGRLICCLRSLNAAPILKSHNIRFYWGFPCETHYELHALKEMGVCYVRLGAGLFFDMSYVKKIGIPVRATPNVANLAYMPFVSGIPGTWIRPEDIDIYDKEGYVDTIEFEDCNTTKEEALFRIYGLEQGWDGPLNELFTNFESDARGCLIHPDVAEARLNCRQKCQREGNCQICYRAMKLANKDIWEKIKTQFNIQKEKIENN